MVTVTSVKGRTRQERSAELLPQDLTSTVNLKDEPLLLRLRRNNNIQPDTPIYVLRNGELRKQFIPVRTVKENRHVCPSGDVLDAIEVGSFLTNLATYFTLITFYCEHSCLCMRERERERERESIVLVFISISAITIFDCLWFPL